MNHKLFRRVYLAHVMNQKQQMPSSLHDAMTLWVQAQDQVREYDGMTDTKQGWGKVVNSVKFHYFQPDGVALCRRWMLISREGLDDTQDTHNENCQGCMNRIARYRQEASDAILS